MSDAAKSNILKFTADIVSAHIRRNAVTANVLQELIQSVFHTLATAGDAKIEPAAQAPAVPIKKSVLPDFIVCLEDGKRLKMLKRYLKSAYNMTPDEYRKKWSLPDIYPMVAPSYSSHRSALAKKIGLGRQRSATATAPAEPKFTVMPARKARGSKG